MFDCSLSAHFTRSTAGGITSPMPVHPQRRRSIVGCLAPVDQNHPGPGPERQPYEGGRRLHHERGAEDEHQVATAGVLFGQHQLRLRQRLTEVHHRGDEPPAADNALRLAWHRLLGAVAPTPPARVPPYILPSVESVAAQATHKLPVAV